jgi:DNA polymerase-3 subunit delta
MIFKSFEINKINFNKNHFYLLYGENEGLKNEIIQKYFEQKYLKKIYRYDEKEIIDNKENFFNSILSKSFFDNEKLIIISRVSDKFKIIIEEIIDKKVKDIKFVLSAGILEKKSRLRALFEKNINTICIPFYADNNEILGKITIAFFKEKKIAISQQSINLLLERCRGNRQNLNNELIKIENFLISKKNINIEEILKLTNLAENYNVSELIDTCLAKNTNKTANILNENNFSIEDGILIIRTLLTKTKRLLKLQKVINNQKNIDQVITSFKPTIFWKDKEVIKQQINFWPLKKIEKLITKISEVEIIIKKNSTNSISILCDFIINQSIKVNS